MIAIVSRVMPRGFPFSSSSKTNRFAVGLRKALGTLYLKIVFTNKQTVTHHAEFLAICKIFEDLSDKTLEVRGDIQ